jgi:hypothetical protein
MIQKTREYDKFNFRVDNREAINQAHVARLKESISARNLLEFRPIIVNVQMEILDGQHRLLAAKGLGVDIYYQVEEELRPEDIIALNVSKSWGIGDFLNYYLKNGYPEYRKLKDFLDKNRLQLKVALRLTMGATDKAMNDYRHGKYIFNNEYNDIIEECWTTIHYIQRMNGSSTYTTTTKFWLALVKLVMHDKFDSQKWRQNLERMVDKFGPRINTKAFADLFMEVHNWRNNNKLDLTDK